MSSRMKLYYSRDLYDHPSTDPLFLEAVRENVEFHRNRNGEYRAILDGKKFRPAMLKNMGDLPKLPFIPTLYFKSHRLWTLPPERMLVKATSSGTGGKKSQMGFNALTCMYGAVLTLRLANYHGLLSMRPVNYLMLGYEPHATNETVIVKTQQISTWFAPALDRAYALNYRDGSYHLELGRLERALARYAVGKAPVRLIGFPSYAYFLLRQLKESGRRYRLPKDSLILLGGGWKQFYKEQVDKEEFYRLVKEVLGLEESRVREFFGAVEHPALYCDCKNHHFHVPVFSRVIVRDVRTLESLGYGKPGLLEFVTPIADGMPLTAVMTDDLGILHEGRECGCGNPAPYFEVIRRAGMREIVTCAAGAGTLLREEG